MNIKYSLVFLISIFCFLTSFGQLQFDIKSFNKKFEVVEWLCRYDNIAWWTSDSVLASPKEEKEKIGSEWFCFQENGNWHAVYGKYWNGNYDLVFHYVVDTSGKVKRVHAPIDSFLLNSYSRALINSNKQLDHLRDTINIRLNQYIRRNEDQTLSVWILPAFSSTGMAIYGGEFNYKFDATGNNLLDKNEYFQNGFRGFKTGKPREIWLDYKDVDIPTLGSIFFVWYYKKYFTNIFIENRNSKSTVFYNKDKSEYYWTHFDNHK